MLVFNDTSKLLVYFWFGLIGLFYIRLFYINRRKFRFAWHNKGFFLPILPVVGQTYVSLLTGKKRNLLGVANWLWKYIGGPLNFWIGHTYHYVTVDTEEIRAILNHPKCLNKANLYDDLQNYFGKSSLAFVSQEEWRGRRKHFAKSFKPSILKGFMSTFYRYSCGLVEDIKKLNGESVSYEYMHLFIFRSFCVTALGLDEYKFGKEMAEFGSLRGKYVFKFNKLIEEAISEKVLNPFLSYSVWINYFPAGRKVAKYLSRCKVILEKIVRERKKELEGNQDYVENSNEVQLLDLILSYNYKMMTDDQIFEEMSLFTSAATETSSYVLYLGLTVLGMYPDIQEKLYNEVVLEIGDKDISPNNIGNLKYTEAVVFEMLRLLPSVPLLARTTGEDVDLGHNKIIPKGVDVVVDVFHLHRDPTSWKDPEKFDPTRFFPENAEKIVPYSYLPFSGGPRDCIGKHHAMALLKITYANIIRSFKITTKHKSIDEFELCSAVTLFPSNPIDVHFISRQ